jgi:hypothetical protein
MVLSKSLNENIQLNISVTNVAWNLQCCAARWHTQTICGGRSAFEVQVTSQLTDRRTVGRSVCRGVEPIVGLNDPNFSLWSPLRLHSSWSILWVCQFTVAMSTIGIDCYINFDWNIKIFRVLQCILCEGTTGIRPRQFRLWTDTQPIASPVLEPERSLTS